MVEAPARGLFDLVVMSAEGGEVAQAGFAAVVVGEGVVGVALGGWPSAAGEDAGGVAEVDQVAQRGGGPVGECFPGVVAVAARQRGESEGPGRWACPGAGSVAGSGAGSWG